MRRTGLLLLMLIAVSRRVGADDRDPLARARELYNDGRWGEAVAAAGQARTAPGRADSADLIAARAYVERFREENAAADLAAARERLTRLNPVRFTPRERAEYIVGLGETLYLDGSFGAAAEMFGSALEQNGPLSGAERERVIDWWASALDRDARPRGEFEQRAIYDRIRSRMQTELGATVGSAAAMYWLAAAARGQGDLQSAWDAAEAGWVRSPLAGDRAAALRADLDRLVLDALVAERARVLAQPPDTLREEWEQFKQRWATERP